MHRLYVFYYLCIIMKELLVRTISGAVLVAIIIACVLLSTWSMAALSLLFVAIGTYEMSRLQKIEKSSHIIVGELFAVGAYLAVALLVLLDLSVAFLVLLFAMAPFIMALFSKSLDFKSIAAFTFGSMAYLSLPCALMVMMHKIFDPKFVLLIFVLLWTNDTFAYLTGKLLGKHKLFERISPGKTIEGSIGGLVFTMVGIIVYSHYVNWLPLKVAIGMGLIAVVFGTLGDLCESMLKRQAGVKDSGNLIPGHGGILDRFDSVLFTVPFVFVYLLLL